MLIEHLHHLIFGAALMVVLSIFAGMLSSRFGAPLLLVFLGLGMLAGEDGVGKISFDDFGAAYLVGSVALAVVLFDGGLRTHLDAFRIAAWPSLSLATFGVLITAGLVGVVAHYFLGFGILESLLVGAIVGSTDAAAVFFLLNVRGMQIQKRVASTLEVESGINDPMAIFLTLVCIGLLSQKTGMDWREIPLEFLRQMLGGAIFGVVGGFVLVWFLNRVDLASGLYPIFTIAYVMTVFGAAQSLDCSGYLAVYLAGLIVGNRRHKGKQLIVRFHDGLAWLMQIVMFLMLGLLVTPHKLVPDLGPAVIVALALMLVARPIAVALSLAPFGFRPREIAFVSWVGLRGAVPIFLATQPVLAGLPHAEAYFAIAFVVVILSLAMQGWTIGAAARVLKLELPVSSEGNERVGIDLPGEGIDRDIAAFRVAPKSPALGYLFHELPLPRRTRVLAVIRDGTVMQRETLEHLEADDVVLSVAPPEYMLQLDRLFAARAVSARPSQAGVFGEFTVTGDQPFGMIADYYCQGAMPKDSRDLALRQFIAKRLRRRPVVGDRVAVGGIELVVQAMVGDAVSQVGIELEPAGSRFGWAAIRAKITGAFG